MEIFYGKMISYFIFYWVFVVSLFMLEGLRRGGYLRNKVYMLFIVFVGWLFSIIVLYLVGVCLLFIMC